VAFFVGVDTGEDIGFAGEDRKTIAVDGVAGNGLGWGDAGARFFSAGEFTCFLG
jgi:hypothetical protein